MSEVGEVMFRLLIYCSALSCLLFAGCGNTPPGSASSAAAAQQRQSTAQGAAPPKAVIKEFDGVVDKRLDTAWKPSELKGLGKEPLGLLQFNDADHGWAASEEGKLYKTADGGKTWESIEIDLPPDSRLIDLHFADPFTGWVVAGRYSFGAGDNRTWLLNSRDGGKSWQTQYESGMLEATRIVFLNEQEGWLVGVKVASRSPIHQTHAVLHTSDQGKNWEDVSDYLNRKVADSSGRVQDFVRDIIPTEPNTANLITRGRSVFGTRDGGKSWQPVTVFENEPPQTCMCSLGLMEDKSLWIGGGADSVEGVWGTLVRGREGSWFRSRTEGIYFRDVVYLSGEQFLACGSTPTDGGEAGVIAFTHDGGRSWKIIYRNVAVKTINRLAIATRDTVWAVGDRGRIIRLDRTQN